MAMARGNRAKVRQRGGNKRTKMAMARGNRAKVREFDIVDMHLCYGIVALMTCLPCGAFVIFGNNVGIAVVVVEWVLMFKIWVVWREMLNHNSTCTQTKTK